MTTPGQSHAHLEEKAASARGEVWMVAGLLLIAGAAAYRAAAAGTFRIDEMELSWVPYQVVRLLLVGGLFALYGGHLLRLFARQAGHPRTWRREIGVALLLQVTAALAIPVLCNDLFNYLLFGNLEAQRHISAATASAAELLSDPFQQWIGDAWRTVPCPYGPLSIGHFALVSWLGGGRVVPSLVFYKISVLIISVAWVALCAFGARRSEAGPDARSAFWLLACSPLWLLEVPGQGHNDGLMALLVLAAALAGRAGRPLWSTIALALATCVKYVALVPFAFVLLWMLLRAPGPWRRRAAAVAAHGTAFLGIVVLCYAPMWEGWRTITTPLSAITTPRLHASFLDCVSWATSWAGRAVSEAAVRAAAASAWIAVAGLTVAWVRGWRARGDDRSVPWETSLKVLLVHLLVVKGFSLPWYQLWLLPLLAAVNDRTWWRITIVCMYVTGLYYLLPRLYPFTEVIAILALVVHGPPLLMLWRAARAGYHPREAAPLACSRPARPGPESASRWPSW
jgi:hypothetical protein